MAAVLPLGLARGHRGNPAASLRIHRLYATPALLNSLGSLVLSTPEITMIEKYLKIFQTSFYVADQAPSHMDILWPK